MEAEAKNQKRTLPVTKNQKGKLLWAKIDIPAVQKAEYERDVPYLSEESFGKLWLGEKCEQISFCFAKIKIMKEAVKKQRITVWTTTDTRDTRENEKKMPCSFVPYVL